MKTLIAESSEVIRQLLASHLRRLGHEVVLAEDGTQAWQAFQKETVPLIISDSLMPGMDGLTLCRNVRALAQEEYTYFILLTGRSGKENYREAMLTGVDDFLSKDSNPEELFLRLKVAERLLSFMAQIRRLKGLLPICTYCRRIRNDSDYWQQIDTYVQQSTGTKFSHGICPDCYDKHVKPELDAVKRP